MNSIPPDVADLVVEWCPAPLIEIFAAGPIRWANTLRSDRTYWVTVYGPGPLPLFRVSIAEEEKAKRFAKQLEREIRNGWVVPKTSLWRRLLPEVDRSGPTTGQT